MGIEWGRKLPRQEDVLCRECNGLFAQNRSTQVFCSKACRDAWNIRKDLKKRRNSPKIEINKPKPRLTEKWVEEHEAVPYMYSATIDKAPLDAVDDHERVADDSAEVLALINGSQLVWAHHIDHQLPDDPYLRLDMILDARLAPEDARLVRIRRATPPRKDTDGETG